MKKWLLINTFIVSLIFGSDLTIRLPQNGAIYQEIYTQIKTIIDNDNQHPDSVLYSLNGAPFINLEKINTDWYTYLGNDQHTGYSESSGPRDTTVLWRAPVTGTLHEFSGPVVSGGIVYYGSNEYETIFALDALSGDEVWRYENVGNFDDAVTVKYGYVFAASDDSVWCLDAMTGEKVWSYLPSGAEGVSGTPAVVNEIAYINFKISRDPPLSIIQALDAYSGDLIWSTEQVPYYSQSCLTVWDSILFWPTVNGSLMAFDANSGVIEWENIDVEEGFWDTSPTLYDGIIYIGGMDSELHAIDAHSGISLWSTHVGGPWGSVESTPALHGDIVFAGGDSVFAVNRYNGEILWKLPGWLHGSSAIADGLIYWGEIVSNDPDPGTGRVRAIDEQTGENVWSYESDHVIFSSPAVTDGIMYLALMDGYLYAFGTGYKYTYMGNFNSALGENELIARAYSNGEIVGSDTSNFTRTSVSIDHNYLPSKMALRNYPNPFNPITTIKYLLSRQYHVTLTIYDIMGCEIKTLVNDLQPEGHYEAVWDGLDSQGKQISTGVYIAKLHTGDYSQGVKMVYLR